MDVLFQGTGQSIFQDRHEYMRYVEKVRTCNKDMPIETLAADIFVSKNYLIRKFKSSIGMTPHQFCIQNRIRKSQEMLVEEKTISRIAVEMGFYDHSHFDKVFQKIVGISPSEYIHSKRQIGILPEFVVAMLQHDEKIEYNQFNYI